MRIKIDIALISGHGGHVLKPYEIESTFVDILESNYMIPARCTNYIKHNVIMPIHIVHYTLQPIMKLLMSVNRNGYWLITNSESNALLLEFKGS